MSDDQQLSQFDASQIRWNIDYYVSEDMTWAQIGAATGFDPCVLLSADRNESTHFHAHNDYLWTHDVDEATFRHEDVIIPAGTTIKLPNLPAGIILQCDDPDGDGQGDVRAYYDTSAISEEQVVTPEETVEDYEYEGFEQPLYTLGSKEDFLRRIWVDEWNLSPDDFDRNEAERRFATYLNKIAVDLHDMLMIAAVQEASETVLQFMAQPIRDESLGSQPMVADDFLAELSFEELVQFYADAYRMLDPSSGMSDDLIERQAHIQAYQYAAAIEAGEEPLLNPYRDFQDDLALRIWYENVYGPEITPENYPYDKYVMLDFAAQLLDKYLWYTCLNEAGDAIDTNVCTGYDFGGIWFDGYGHPIDSFYMVGRLYSLAETLTLYEINQLLEELANRTREVITAREAAIGIDPNNPEQAPFSPHAQARGFAENIQEKTSTYFDALRLDQLRQIVFDPDWNRERAEEGRLLEELHPAIEQIRREILGVNIGFVQDGFRQFYEAIKSYHDSCMAFKAGIAENDLELLALQDEDDWDRFKDFLEIMAVLVGTGLGFASLLGAPWWAGVAADTADLLTGDPLALLGIPGMFDDLGRGVRGLGVVDDSLDFYRQYPYLHDTVDFDRIYFSQWSVSPRLRDGTPLTVLAETFVDEGWDLSKGRADVIRWWDARIQTLDHRRLVAANIAELQEIPVTIRPWDIPIPDKVAWRFQLRVEPSQELIQLTGRSDLAINVYPNTWGEAALFRAANQSARGGPLDFPLRGTLDIPEIR